MFRTKNALCQLWWVTTIPSFKCAKITYDKYEYFWASVMSSVNHVKTQLWKYKLCYDSDSQAQLCQFQLWKYQLCALLHSASYWKFISLWHSHFEGTFEPSASISVFSQELLASPKSSFHTIVCRKGSGSAVGHTKVNFWASWKFSANMADSISLILSQHEMYLVLKL